MNGTAMPRPQSILSNLPCHHLSPSDLGCMGELTLQLAIVFVGRQTINNFQEMCLPAIFRWWRKRQAGEDYEVDGKQLSPWERDVRH